LKNKISLSQWRRRQSSPVAFVGNARVWTEKDRISGASDAPVGGRKQKQVKTFNSYHLPHEGVLGALRHILQICANALRVPGKNAFRD